MQPLYIGIIIGSVGLLFLVIGLVLRRKAARILTTPLFKTGDAARANGAASAEGTVVVQQPLAAAITATPCAYFTLRIEKKVKEKRGGQVTTKWVKLIDQPFGSTFALDDGSGAVYVHAIDPVDGDLEQTFAGPPPGGQLGALGDLVANVPSQPGEEILEYKVTERVIRSGGRLFVAGLAQNGQIAKQGNAKLLVSTRGRDALVGSTKRSAMLMSIVGGLALAGGATVAVVQPGVRAPCGTLTDGFAECALDSKVTSAMRMQAGGPDKMETFRRVESPWTVTKAGKYELTARDPRKGKALPTIQVFNEIGLPMNLDLGLGIGAGAYSTATTTKKLLPGTYTVVLFSTQDANERLYIEAHPAQ